MTYVVDASVAVKWLSNEIHAVFAARLLSSKTALIAPDLLPVEVARALLKKSRSGDYPVERIAEAVAQLSLPLMFAPIDELAEEATLIAIRYDRTIYDAVYVTLALRDDCQLVTADRRLYNALEPHLPETMLWIADVPAEG